MSARPRTGNTARRSGRNRELQTLRWFEAQGWTAFRVTLACADLVALHPDFVPELVEVKSTSRSPWVAFGPAQRRALSVLAASAGARPVVAWWPPRAPGPTLIHESDWPGYTQAAVETGDK